MLLQYGIMTFYYEIDRKNFSVNFLEKETAILLIIIILELICI